MVEDKKLEQSIQSIRHGDELTRERLIKYYSPYILNIVGHICKRYISWSDEESSVGLIAFNKAIESFDENKGRTFHSYVYLIIKRDLVDFFKREAHSNQTLSLDIESRENRVDQQYAIDEHFKSLTNHQLVDEIMEFDFQLSQYGVSFDELEQFAPKHKKTIHKLHELGKLVAQTKSYVDELVRLKRLPISSITRDTKFKYKTIEKHRKYLIAIILIHCNPSWTQLKEFVIENSEREGAQ
ncbi:RNA polymerase sigma-I factor [Alkalibacillus sp. S2W]|uniref:RNA polymerase sigma-I factor n=1 Tax=Alkalibacillus sp. S2W TaxID=3386553 RepID=UPI00398CC106